MMMTSNRSPSRCWRVEEWPTSDRAAWQRAQKPGDLLEDGGFASRWSKNTSRKTASGYGRFLGWLSHHGLLDPDSAPAGRITRACVDAYIKELAEVNGGYTLFCRTQELYDAIRVMAPDRDWRWLCRLAGTLRSRAVSVKNKRARLRPAGELVELGRRLMNEAERRPGWSPLRRAVHYRDGLMIALLAHRPLRLGNYTATAVGRHLVRHAAGYWLSFTALETKNRRVFEAPIPISLGSFLDRYLGHYRPILLTRGDRQPAAKLNALWVSEAATPMAQISIHNRIRKHTRAVFGAALPPHWFRDASVTTIAIEDPVHVRSAMNILGDASLAVTEKHYNQARSLEASRRYQDVLADLRRRLSKVVA
jgi:hypothetical protein